MPDQGHDPFITFYQLYPNAPAPCRADSSLFGAISLRAHRFCEPFTAASGFGWYVFPPINFSLVWDGKKFFWKREDDSSWQQFDWAVFPGFAEHYRQFAPADMAKFGHIPFLGTAPEQEIVQIWTGLLIKTRPDWAILVRPPANLPRNPAYEVLDGIIETDWWFGPVISPLRICKTDQPISFRTRRPLFQVQPILKSAYADKTLDSMTVIDDLALLQEADWQASKAALQLRNSTKSPIGSYKIEARRRKQRTRLRP